MSDRSDVAQNENDFDRSQDNPGALLNTNNRALEAYKKAKTRFRKLNTIEALGAAVDQNTNDINEIKQLLGKILSKLG